MSSSKTNLNVSDMRVEFIRKDIKNVHLSVLPPDGKVRLSAPMNMTEDSARLAIVTRWSWIKKKQKQFASQRRETQREFVDGETHYFDGNRYLLKVVETTSRASVKIKGNGRIELSCPKGASRQARQKAFDFFYRSYLQALIERKLNQYCSALSVERPKVQIRRMRTKWGSCTAVSRRVLVNLELAKKPAACFEYILAHELVHLRVRRHNDQFKSLLEDVMPDWRQRRDLLNSLPLAYDEWDY